MKCKKEDKFTYEKYNILNDILETREKNIYETAENEKELVEKENKKYTNIYSIIDNIPNSFTETRKQIKMSIENYLETLSTMQATENEKFYKEGFSDAIKLLVECLYKNPNKNKNSKF